MKKLPYLAYGVSFLALATAVLSCNEDDNQNTNQSSNAPTAQEFDAIRQEAISSRVQNFTFDIADGNISLTSAQGVTISFNANCLTKNGNPVTGSATLQYVELFGGGDMAATNKTTMGRMNNGDKAMLLSGGEFYIQAYQNGEKLDTSCGVGLIIPASLTGGINDNMSLWTENANTVSDTVGTADLDWVAAQDQANGQEGVWGEGTNYYAYFGEFGWTNVDCFYNDPNPKTTILANVPDGYDDENSTVYLSYDGRGNALARLDTYDDTTGLFSEHYGQIPIGLACHAIFVTEQDGLFRYAIKGVTIEEGMVISFEYSDTQTGTEAELVAAISAVQD